MSPHSRRVSVRVARTGDQAARELDAARSESHRALAPPPTPGCYTRRVTAAAPPLPSISAPPETGEQRVLLSGVDWRTYSAIRELIDSPGALPLYERLGVKEVWFWVDQSLRLFALGDDGYQAITRSAVLPELDVDLLARFVPLEDQHAAVKGFRDALRASA